MKAWRLGEKKKCPKEGPASNYKQKDRPCKEDAAVRCLLGTELPCISVETGNKEMR